jgi:penicillin-binding protein 1A
MMPAIPKRRDPQVDELAWRQHFPTYNFKKRDIALKEYEFATKTLETEERVFLNAVNISILVGAALGSLALGSVEKLAKALVPVVPPTLTLAVLLTVTFCFGVVLLRHFADRQKAVVYAARKVIVLRRMLGMTYGSLQLVLPNWRIEGADEPFAVRLFPGWNTYVIYPCFAVGGICSVVAFFLGAEMVRYTAIPTAFGMPAYWPPVAASLGYLLILCWIYRKALLDTHERPLLLLMQDLARTLRLRLVPNFEYVIYRASLARHELHRLKVDLAPLTKLLIYIEDKEFYKHKGISWKGLARLLRYMARSGRRTGGSTITQQLVRTLFIADQDKLVRRKAVEIGLALWFDKVMSKTDQLEMYLAAVRYERGVYGVIDAMKHFFGAQKRKPSLSEAFFLLERVSNVRSRLLVEKVDQTLRALVSSGQLSMQDAKEVVDLYKRAIASGKMDDPSRVGIARLERAWASSSVERAGLS